MLLLNYITRNWFLHFLFYLYFNTLDLTHKIFSFDKDLQSSIHCLSQWASFNLKLKFELSEYLIMHKEVAVKAQQSS